jgi:hypothetical protein
MGRNLKYKTKEEQRIASNKKSMRYYEKNKELIKERNLKKYYEKKKMDS